MTTKQAKVLECRLKGMCCTEIVEELGARRQYINETVKKIGMPFTEIEKQRSIQFGKEKSILRQRGTEEERIRHNIEYISQKHPDFEYVSGWLGGGEAVKLRCKKCGDIITKSANSLRGSHKVRCRICEEVYKKQKQKEDELKREYEKEQKRREKEKRFWEQSFEQAAVSFCPECGSIFVGRKKYCSSICLKRSSNSTKKDKRLRKIKERKMDYISLRSLYMRDHGRCWICGGVCDFEDYSRDQDGNFIVGGNYPSIDHVYPLSKGGMHSWDNVKLAHHYCNSVKCDKVVSL